MSIIYYQNLNGRVMPEVYVSTSKKTPKERKSVTSLATWLIIFNFLSSKSDIDTDRQIIT